MEKKLRTPILVGDESVETISLRPAIGKDLRKMDELEGMKPFAQSMLLVEVVTGLDADAVDQMDGTDIIEIAEASEDFLPDMGSDQSTERSGDPSSQTSPRS